ncbi:hypothetical protein [Streptomyces sp. NPDC060184]|uniref:hypothetical protein n=1 Tax=Streptomyces sp. NPDC060184 TaxID=3347064 RepID=UPI00365707A8
MNNRLGPLEYINGSWIIGDPNKDHLRFEQSGMSHRVGGVEEPPVPWDAFTEMEIYAVATRLGNSKGLAKATQIMANLRGASVSGGGPAHLMAHLRNGRGAWKAEFSHHARWYPPREIRILSRFLGQVAERGEASHLGDPAWVSTVVERLRQLPHSLPRARKAAIKQILDDCPLILKG